MAVKTPTFKLTLGAVDFSLLKLKKYIQSIEVEMTSDGPSTFKIVLDDCDKIFSGGAECVIREGDSCVISLGFIETEVPKMIQGIVTGVKANRKEYSRMYYEISGMDGLQALTRGKKRRSWENIKISDIAATIANECSLQPDCEDSGEVLPFVVQNNLTDLKFLMEQAAMIGFEVKVEEKRLVFKKPVKIDTGLILTMKPKNSSSFEPNECMLQRCNLNSSTMQVVNKVVVRWYDPKQAKAIIAECSKIDDKMGGKETAAERASANNPDTTIQISDTPVYSQAQAEALASAVLNKRADYYLTGSGTCEGNPKLKCGAKVKIANVGKEMDGEYYITKAKHSMKVGNGQDYGYWTEFEVSRSAR
ncbi:MAG: phage late control D family protein [Proteobacteria bacterium]|jgi:phage protein D|nr:phage late control D family protein [Pseudomonadota bacterium]